LPSLREKTKDICNVLINGEWVDRAKIASLLTRAFIGLVPLPDRPDFLATINNKTIEYLSFGLPIIVSPERSKVARLARENGFGLSWDGYSSDQLINCIQKLIDSDVNYNKMSRAASTYFSENFNAEKVYSQYIEHIEQIAQAYNRT
jgi:glycosyltransferase involved in cell wall biosynthesis